MRTVTPAETRTVDRGHGYALADYLGDHGDTAAGPQAYLVRQGTAELGAHFHEVDQFQVVVGGAGTLGREAVGRGVLHYADAYTSYGPIRTDPAVGLEYVTLRLEPTTGINPMPQEREKRRAAGGGGEHFTCALDPTAEPGTRARELARTRRGARALAMRLPAGAAAEADGLPATGRGYAVVIAGALRDGDRVLPAGSVVALDRPAELGGLVADDATGAELAVCLFPEAGGGAPAL
ncbi:hypothetical protein [Blastococcus sp. TF02A-26]|uniref:hypothetical protein n=1 Tax=Blastococcus sp. TF02A-26 TaxID=2250577 RepID=UPI000DEAFB3F|nr:hypothetical protein [Blastococcus sp. TF02A-26]RBY82253.1 hypothetical protein DQ240_19380 [Blastococcus sp. TF02A-26]